MLLQVRGQDGFNDQEAEALELHVIQVDQKVKLRLGKVEAPGCGGVVVLQNGPVIVEHGLRGGRRQQVVRGGNQGQIPTTDNISYYAISNGLRKVYGNRNVTGSFS